MTDIRIEQVTWNDHGQQLLSIRHRVFVEEQGVPRELEHDTHDAEAIHLLATGPQGEMVATARLLSNGHIGRMAVLTEWRNLGIGTALMRHLLDIATKRGMTRVFLHAQCRAIPFYEHLGFVAEGAIFKDAGIDHQMMQITLSTKAS